MSKDLNNAKEKLKEKATSKKTVASKLPKKQATKKTTSTKKKTTLPKKVSNTKTSKVTKKSTVKKTSKKPETKKVTSNKSVKSKATKSIKKTTSKKSTNKKEVSKSTRKKIEVLEYYDLPYRYNETLVKILVQTPDTLFVYWDISDFDRQQYILNYGENFFNDTYPVLLVFNKTLNYVTEVPINDFANSWYLKINDPRCEYSIELGRKYKNNPKSEYIYVKDSNPIIVPNDHVLIKELKSPIKYKNVKTNQVTFKEFSTIFLNKKIKSIYDLLKNIFGIDDINKIDKIYDLNNPSSGNSSSVFK